MALALPEGGVIHACDISPEYPAIGAARVLSACKNACWMGYWSFAKEST
jgi:hypothetical protein